MATPILVVGHKNPDNDAICAAIGYAWLKNELAAREVEDGEEPPVYMPARLGPLPPESAGVLDKWGIPVPMIINNLYARVSDVMTYNPICRHHNRAIGFAGKIHPVMTFG